MTVLSISLFSVLLMGLSRYYIDEAIEKRQSEAFSGMQAASEAENHEEVIEFSNSVDRDMLSPEEIYTYDVVFAKALGSLDYYQDSLSIYRRLADNYTLKPQDAISAGQLSEEADDSDSALYFYQLALDIHQSEESLEPVEVVTTQQKVNDLLAGDQ